MNPGLNDSLYYDSPEHFFGIVLTCIFYFVCAWVPVRLISWLASGFFSDWKSISK
jgi:hypothetical protein